MTLQEILNRLEGVRGHGGQYMARCPAHPDKSQSLSVGLGKDGRIVMHCHAGCSIEDIVEAMGLQKKDLFAEYSGALPRYDPPKPQGKAQFEREHIYPGGQLKKVIMRKPEGGKYGCWFHMESGKWVKGRNNVVPPLYTVEPLDGVIFVAEGEKDVETLCRLGFSSASGADGAGPGKWRKEHTEQLRDRHVCVLHDNDKVGKDFAVETCNALNGVAASVRLLDLATVWPEIPEHGDVSDMVSALGADKAAELIVQLSFEASEWEMGDLEDVSENVEKSFVPFDPFVPPDISKNPVFPAEELTDVLRNFVVALAEDLQVAVDMPAVSVLAAISLCAQKKFLINPKPGWLEPVNLYASVVALPSERKSSVQAAVMSPIHEFVKAENERRRTQVEEYQTRKDMLQRRIESMKKTATSGRRAKSGEQATTEDVMMLYRELEDLEHGAIDYLCLVSDDITMEALASVMEANNEKMAIVSSEGGIFNTLAGLYSNGVANMDIFLKSYSGDFFQSDRKRGKRETLHQPALTVLLMVQQSILETIMGNSDFKGRGLLARFLYSLPMSLVGHRRYDTTPVPPEVENSFRDLVYRLLSIPDTEKAQIIYLSQEAQKEARKLFYDIEPRLSGDLAQLGDWAGKHHGRVMRIAALLHICDHVEEAANIPLPGETVRRARVIGDYFIEHAKAAYQIMGTSEDQASKDAKYILKRLDASGQAEINKRDLWRMCDGHLGTIDVFNQGLTVLQKHGYICIEIIATGGRPTEVIYVCPEYLKTKGTKGSKA